MKQFNTTVLFFVVFLSFQQHLFSQPIGYYNGTEGKNGDELKTALNQIINDHVDYSYSFAKNIINYSDADPDNPDNVIVFYLQESRQSSHYGSGDDDINREHVWAKSHGYFADINPMNGDAFNLRPADASVNMDRGNKDFDIVQPGGHQHQEATSCWYTDSTWEPGPVTKGQVARILFYMATRYEGNNGEMDLEVVPHNNTYPKPAHGNLTTLLEWNNQYPPSDFERTRNERIYRIQQNRNPFVDNPDFANYIWKNEAPSGSELQNFKILPNYPVAGEDVQITIDLVQDSGTPDSLKLFWGNAYNSSDFQYLMTKNQSTYTASIKIPDYNPGELVYFTIEISENQTKKYIRADYKLPAPDETITLTPIAEVQGTGTTTPLSGQKVTISGRVTANYDGSFYLQNGTNLRNAICIYGSLQTGKIGDSLVVTGNATEYSNLTELNEVSYLYNFQNNKNIDPLEISIAEINEDHEGMLVFIRAVEFEKQGTTIDDGNNSYSFSNSGGSSVIFSKSYSRLVGNKIPSGKIDLVGVVGQFQNNYQILPRDMNDFRINTDNTEIQLADETVTVYPNPTSTVVRIKTTKSINCIKIIDLSGKQLTNIQGDNKEISVENLMPGVYILQVSLAKGEVLRTKFIKSSEPK